MAKGAKFLGLLISVLMLVFLGACGGGGGGGGSTSSSSTTPSVTLSGTAASGAPIVGIVNVKGANGNTASATIDTDGHFSLNVSQLTAPYILYAEGSVNGKSVKLYSSTVATGTINITPVTDFIVRNALGGNPDTAYQNWDTSATITKDALNTATQKVDTQLKPLLAGASVSDTFNPMGGSFSANGTGYDKALDALNITYNTNGTTATVTNDMTGSQFTDDVTTTSDDSNALPSSDEDATKTAETDKQAISTIFQQIETLYSTSRPTSQQLTDFFTNYATTSDFLDAGMDSQQTIASWVNGPAGPPIGVQFTSIILKKITVANYSRAFEVHGYYSASGATGDFATKVVYNGSKWLWYGDQKWVKYDFCSEDHMAVDSSGTKTFNAGFSPWIEDTTNYAYNHGIRSAVITGPGLPSSGLVMQNMYPQTYFEFLSGGNHYWVSNDTTLNSIPDNSTYTIELCTQDPSAASDSNCSNDDHTTITVAKSPIPNSQLKDTLFPDITKPNSHDLNDANIGSILDLTWANPTDSYVTYAELDWWDNNGSYESNTHIQPGATTASLDLSTYSANSAQGGQIWMNSYDAYLRRYSVQWSMQPHVATYAIASDYLQYRTNEDSTKDGYRTWIGLTKDGQAIQSGDVTAITVTDSSNTTVDTQQNMSFYSGTYYDYDLTGATPSQTGPFLESGFYDSAVGNAPVGTYTIEIQTANNQTVTKQITNLGPPELPVVTHDTMQSQYNTNGDLVLSWTNPTSAANWSEVESLRVVLLDQNGIDRLYITLPSNAESETIPKSLIDQIAGLGSGTGVASWQVQTRAYDTNGMNYARGNSNTVAISNPSQATYAFSGIFLQYRNYETSANNTYRSWIGLTKNGQSIQSSDVVGITITDSLGNVVLDGSNRYFYTDSFYNYDCTGTTPTQSGPINDSGFLDKITNIPQGTYTVEVDTTDNQSLTSQVTYTGQLLLPFIHSNTMQSTYDSNGNLTLSWTNPTGETNWSKVTTLRVILDDQNNDRIYVSLPTNAETVTIPKALLDQAAGLGSNVAWWKIQTRAYDTSGMNYARGYSNTIALSNPNQSAYSFDGGYLQYRTYETSANNSYRTWIGLTKNGQSIQSSDVTAITVTDSQGSTVWDGTNRYFYAGSYYDYDCTGTTPTQSGPLNESGFVGKISSLPAGTYTVEVDTADSQSLTTQVTYSGQLLLPVIQSNTMQSTYDANGNLTLSWTNPTGETNWSEVTRLQITLLDQDGIDRLYVELPPNAVTVTIPKALVDQVAGLGSGVANWQIQTRAYDTNGMNIARGISNSAAINATSTSISGYWDVDIASLGGKVDALYLTQSGTTFAGTNLLGQSVTGTINGTTVQLSFTDPNYVNNGCSTFAGTLSNDTISGTCAGSTMGGITFKKSVFYFTSYTPTQTLYTSSPLFAWKAFPGADKYYLRVMADNSQYTCNTDSSCVTLWSQGGITGTSIQYSGSLAPGYYRASLYARANSQTGSPEGNDSSTYLDQTMDVAFRIAQ